ncbi:hypothetical protein ACIGXM_30385 [Kitasatospora sp. NPDC052896]|uniref:hypothetical protein n=1 Tax=Kitasatospora sp. NPDC052896 TaxID=3364061 RepID=UPI0037C52494
MFRTTIRSAGAAALLVSGALLLTGCSSSGSSSSTAASSSPTAAASGSRGQAMAAYTSCLQQHGVTMPTGRPSGHPSGAPGGGYGGGFAGSSPDPARQAAMQACASLRPQGGGRGGNFNSSAMAAFTSCLKDHGVTIPATGGMKALNTADPTTAAAYKTCAPLMPARPSGQPSAAASSSPSA